MASLLFPLLLALLYLSPELLWLAREWWGCQRPDMRKAWCAAWLWCAIAIGMLGLAWSAA